MRSRWLGRALGAVFVTVAIAVTGNSIFRQQGSSLATVLVSPNGPYLVRGGTPFLIDADSAGSIININTTDSATYFADRKARGFNAVLIHAICGTGTGCTNTGATQDGLTPFTTGTDQTNYDLSTPRETYWKRIDTFVNQANANGLTVLLDPTDESSYLSAFQASGSTKAFNFGVFIGNRYKTKNIIYWIGNDFQTWRTAADTNIVKQEMDGIKSVDPNHVMTAQLDYFVSSTLDNTTFAPDITLNGVYSYLPMYDEVYHAIGQSAATPTFYEEGSFEGQQNPSTDLGTPKLLRQQEYWTVLAGGRGGAVYGNGPVHHFNTGWQSHLGDPGAVQTGYWSAFMSGLPWWKLVPDQAHTVLTAGFGTYSATGSPSANDYATAARASDGSYVAVYAPTVRTMTIDMTKLSGPNVSAQWFDPSSGTYSTVSGSPFPNTGNRTFTPTGNNSEGSGDWVLLLRSTTQAAAQTANVWLDTNGGTCTRFSSPVNYNDAAACATPAAAWTAANSGDTIGVTAGTWTSGLALSGNKTSKTTFIGAGTSQTNFVEQTLNEFNMPVNFAAFQDLNFGEVHVTGNNVTFTNVTVDCQDNAPYPLITPANQCNARFAIDGSHFLWNGGDNGPTYIPDSSFCTSNNGEGQSGIVESGSNATDITIRNVKFHDARNTGCAGSHTANLRIDGGSFITLDHDWFDCSGSTGTIFVSTNGSTVTEDHLLIENNLFTDTGGCTTGSPGFQTIDFNPDAGPGPPTNVTVRNNYMDAVLAIKTGAGSYPSMVIANNVWSGGSCPAGVGVVYHNNATWVDAPQTTDRCGGDASQVGVGQSTNVTGGPPSSWFACGSSCGRNATDYLLATGSPLIDAGFDAQTPSVDYANNARPCGAHVDISLYEKC